jgi:putative DNA primase/helicase
MAALFDELIHEKYLLDDDDEEGDDESWVDDQCKRETKVLDEGIKWGLDNYPNIDAINKLPRNDLPQDLVPDAEQLSAVLRKCAIGATRFEQKPREQLARLVRTALKKRFENDTKYRTHVREDVPGSDIKSYGSRGRTSSKGTFARSDSFENGGGLAALFTGPWLRVAKDRIDPYAWSHEFAPERKTENKHWRHCFFITERDGRRSFLEIPREKLAGAGKPAISLLMKAGVHVIRRDAANKALVRFLGFKPRREIVRMPRPGWAEIDGRWIFVRPDEVITPPGAPEVGDVTYILDAAVGRHHGLHIAGTTNEWAAEVAEPLRGNSNVALSLATFFAAPLLRFASEPGGGNHFFGPSTIGKTMVSAVGQSINGYPLETANNAFGVSWGGTEAGSDAFAQARTDLGIALDEITRANRRKAEQIVYTLASGTRGPRARSTGQLRETPHASVPILSTGEKSLEQFVGKDLQEGARKRLVDVPAEVQPGSAFESIPRDRIHIEGKVLYDAMKRQHGAVGRDWQRYLVALGPDQIKAGLNQHRAAFLDLSPIVAVIERAHPQVAAVVNRFALYAAALRMAIVAGLLPWTIEEADMGILACMERWVRQRGNINIAGEVLRATNAVKRELVAGLDSRLIRIVRKRGKGWVPATEADAAKQKTPELFDGYVKADRILVRPEAWRRYSNGFDHSEIARQLHKDGALIADVRGGKLSRSEKIMGRTERFYVLKRASLASHGNTATP